MSHYKNHRARIRSIESLVEKLVEAGVPREVIEVHREPAQIFNHADCPVKQRKDDERFTDGVKCHVIIRRKHVGAACNDLGFYIDDESSEVFICDFTRRNGTSARIDAARKAGGWHALVGKVTQDLTVESIQQFHLDRGETPLVETDDEGNQYVYVNA